MQKPIMPTLPLESFCPRRKSMQPLEVDQNLLILRPPLGQAGHQLVELAAFDAPMRAVRLAPPQRSVVAKRRQSP